MFQNDPTLRIEG